MKNSKNIINFKMLEAQINEIIKRNMKEKCAGNVKDKQLILKIDENGEFVGESIKDLESS